MVELDLFVLTPVIGGFVAMAVGFVSIYSNIKTTKQKARAALDKNISEVKADLRDYVSLKLDAMDVKIESVRNEMRQAHILEGKTTDTTKFFTSWIQRIEDRIERLHPPVKGEPETK